jgi:hypothetical protein
LKVLQKASARERLGPCDTLWIGPDGIVDNSGRSYDFYHWVTEKTLRKFQYPTWHSMPERYLATHYGFFDASTPRRNLMIALYRRMRATALFARDRATYTLHRYLGITLDRRWVGQKTFR